MRYVRSRHRRRHSRRHRRGRLVGELAVFVALAGGVYVAISDPCTSPTVLMARSFFGTLDPESRCAAAVTRMLELPRSNGEGGLPGFSGAPAAARSLLNDPIVALAARRYLTGQYSEDQLLKSLDPSTVKRLRSSVGPSCDASCRAHYRSLMRSWRNSAAPVPHREGE